MARTILTPEECRAQGLIPTQDILEQVGLDHADLLRKLGRRGVIPRAVVAQHPNKRGWSGWYPPSIVPVVQRYQRDHPRFWRLR